MTAGSGPQVCKVHFKRVYADASLAAVTEVFSSLSSASILGGNPAKRDADGLTYWAAEPREVFEFISSQTDPFAKLEAILGRYTLTREGTVHLDSSYPKGAFCGGWIGYFAYELGRHIERLPGKAVDDLHLPLVRLCFYDRLIAYDHRSDAFWVVALEMPGDTERPADKLASLEQRLRQSEHVRPVEPPRGRIAEADLARMRRNMTTQNYLDAVSRVETHIRDGDVYQVNFSHRFEVPFHGSPVQLFHWQNRYNPSGYAAYVDAGSFQIVSASPEMFVTIHDGRIQTKPIKGTRPRVEDSCPQAAAINAAQFHDLLVSEKEQAELNMIVDLERNDVAKICKPGTRQVLQGRTIETCPTVYHGVATIGGELRDDVTFCDVLKAMFPGGSITGAPKIRALEIIDDLEPTARSVYTGAIGFLGLDGSVCLNIAIRTIIIARASAFVQSGGGIVADSDPHAEWEETMVKAKALLAGIRAVQGARSEWGAGPRAGDNARQGVSE